MGDFSIGGEPVPWYFPFSFTCGEWSQTFILFYFSTPTYQEEMWEAKIITSAWKSPSSQVGINFCEEERRLVRRYNNILVRKSYSTKMVIARKLEVLLTIKKMHS
jgi:hypothetical protein